MMMVMMMTNLVERKCWVLTFKVGYSFLHYTLYCNLGYLTSVPFFLFVIEAQR